MKVLTVYLGKTNDWGDPEHPQLINQMLIDESIVDAHELLVKEFMDNVGVIIPKGYSLNNLPDNYEFESDENHMSIEEDYEGYPTWRPFFLEVTLKDLVKEREGVYKM